MKNLLRRPVLVFALGAAVAAALATAGAVAYGASPTTASAPATPRRAARSTSSAATARL